MSLDYPFYEELRRRRHPAAKWWRLGDTLYYLGLLPAMILFIPAVATLASLAWGTANWKVWIIAAFLFCASVFLAGTRFKLISWKMAAKDGIDVDDY